MLDLDYHCMRRVRFNAATHCLFRWVGYRSDVFGKDVRDGDCLGNVRDHVWNNANSWEIVRVWG